LDIYKESNMSSVAIKDLYWEVSNDKYASNVWNGYKDIEVVPRKMVEMIIAKCTDHASGPKPSDYIISVSNEADWIAKYAESLLKQFEEDPE
jgi:hypothetical protein